MDEDAWENIILNCREHHHPLRDPCPHYSKERIRPIHMCLFRRLVGGVPWDSVLKSKGVQDGWSLFKKEVLKAQEQAVPLSSKMSQRERRSAWMSKELFLRLQEENRIYLLWKKGRPTRKEYKEVVKMCREKIRKAKGKSPAGTQPCCWGKKEQETLLQVYQQ